MLYHIEKNKQEEPESESSNVRKRQHISCLISKKRKNIIFFNIITRTLNLKAKDISLSIPKRNLPGEGYWQGLGKPYIKEILHYLFFYPCNHLYFISICFEIPDKL